MGVLKSLSTRKLMQDVLSLPGTGSLKENLYTVPNIPGGASLKGKLKLLGAIHGFAPVVKLHPTDSYRPSSVGWYLPRVRMRRHRPIKSDVSVLGEGQVDLESLISQSSGGQQSGSGGRSAFFLEITGGYVPSDLHKAIIAWRAILVAALVSGVQSAISYAEDKLQHLEEQALKHLAKKEETREGNLDSAECYVHFFQRGNNSPYEVQYWFFYPYSGDIAPGLDIAHEGDWEHVTLRFSSDLQSIASIYFAAHDGGAWFQKGFFEETSGGRPIVYSARHSHASYNEAGSLDTQDLVERALQGAAAGAAVGGSIVGGAVGAIGAALIAVGAKDKTSSGGPSWDTWNSLRATGERSQPIDGQLWVKYNGRWGELGAFGGQVPGTSGPYGPALQSSWVGD